MITYEIQLRYVIRDKIQSENFFSDKSFFFQRKLLFSDKNKFFGKNLSQNKNFY